LVLLASNLALASVQGEMMTRATKAADQVRLARYDRLVSVLSRNCPIRGGESPAKIGRWLWAYNALFAVHVAKGSDGRR